jgi:hypothetical protein
LKPKVAFLVGLVVFGSGANARAIRPFVTDDARVVGRHTPQLETWIQADRRALQHWLLPAFGPTDWLELTLGGAHGTAPDDPGQGYSVTVPLLQAKALVQEGAPNGLPGVAGAAGVLTHGGHGVLRASDPVVFGYVAATESLFPEERLLIHINLGLSREVADGTDTVLLAGLGTQLHVVAGLFLLGEILWNDPYAGALGGGWQVGGRYGFGDHVQIDTSIGSGLGDTDRSSWVTLGLRLVGSPLW